MSPSCRTRLDGPGGYGRTGGGRHVERDQLAEVVTDGHDPVLRGADGGEHVRTRLDSGLAGRLRSAFEQHGYPWCGTVDPHESAYTLRGDDTPGLDETAHALLRERRRAVADDRTGAADEAREALQGTRHQCEGPRQGPGVPHGVNPRAHG
ncbi:YqeB family protein [Streptomyces flavochromogenes]